MNGDHTMDGGSTKLAQRSAKDSEGFVIGVKKRSGMPAKGGKVVHVEVSKQRTGRIALACKWAMSQVLKKA